MKKKTIKLTDSSLMGIINEAIDEFRSDDFGEHGHDGDFHYTRPNGRTNLGTKLKWSDNSNTKRAKHNHRFYPDGKLASVSGVEQVVYGHGKGSLCNNVMEFMQKEFQVDLFGKPTGKIEWTEKEQEAINDIIIALSKLAQLTKEEGNKKRGYNGPEESEEPEELNEAFGHTTEEEKLEAMRQWKEENLADDLDWEVCDRIDYYDTCLAGTVTSDEGWKFTAYGNGDEHGDFVEFDDNAPEIEFEMPDGREGYFNPKDIKVSMSESQLRNYIYEKVKKNLSEAVDDPAYMLGNGSEPIKLTIALDSIVESEEFEQELFQELVNIGLAKDNDDAVDANYRFMDEKFMPRLQNAFNNAASRDASVEKDKYGSWVLQMSYAQRYADIEDAVGDYVKTFIKCIDTISQQGGAFEVAGRMAKTAYEEVIEHDIDKELRQVNVWSD
jgi:hypothetical protein